MRIYIGDEALQFELTETLPFNQILQKLSAWAESQNLYIIDYRVAAKPEFAGKEDLNSDEIDVINLQIGDQAQLIESNLRELIDYTDRAGLHVARTIQEDKHLTEQEERDLKNGGAFIAESIETLSKHLEPENAEALAKALNELNTNPDLIEKINALAQVQNQLKLWLRQLEFSRISKEEAAERINNFRAQTAELSDKLERIAAFFTQGKEQDALQLLDSVSQTLVDAVILLRIAEDPKKVGGERLIELLGKITAAVDSRDLVTAADIVDFDLRDLLKEL
ncbi:MAG: hypothetical protein JNJ69_16010 [Leptospiraceae bacterium]|nr:hypothetical protein [Leptospiraceae bacterium]